MVYRVRKQLVEEGFEAVLSRKPRATPAVPRIFDGEKEAKLIALACSKPPQGYVRWTLRLLENKVVELGIVDRASDSTCRKRMRQSATVGACERHGRTKTPRERSPTCSESSFDTAKRARCPATARQGPPLVAIEFQDPRNRKRDRFDIGLRLGACLNHTLRPRFPTLRRFRYVWIRRRHC